MSLSDVCTKASSGFAQKDLEELEGEYPVYGASGYIKSINQYHQEKEYIAVVKDGAGIGRTMILPAKSSIIGTMQYLLPKENILPRYLYYAVKNMHLEKYYTGATIPHIYFKDYQKEQFNLPDIYKQNEVVEVLEIVEKITEKRNAQLNVLDTLIKARFVEMFGDPLAGTEKWSFQTVGDVADSVDPQPSHRTPPVVEGGIPYVSMKDCNYKNGTIDFAGARKVSPDVLVEHHNRYELHNGDFIIGKIGTIGNPIFVPKRDDYALSANVVLIQPNSSKVSPYFLKETFESSFVERQFLDAKNSTSQVAFGIKKVRNIKIMNPDMKTQMEFENFAIQVDKLKFVETIARF